MKVDASPRPHVREQPLAWALPGMLVLALLVRLLLIGNEGFKTDVNTFEAWAIALAERGFANFYTSAGFADYPPGYLYILAAVGYLWEGLFKHWDASGAAIRALVKLPAIVADLGIGVLVYALVRRFAATGIALGAAALYLFNPAVIYNSAVWGQVDSVAAGLALFALYALLKSDDGAGDGINGWIVAGWLLIAYSLLIKPQAAVLVPLMAAFVFVDPARRRTRAISSAIGIIASLLLALLLTEPFHHSNPLEAFSWLIGRYEYGSNVYPFNSVNAFNLWAIRGAFWQPDTGPIYAFGGLSLGPQYVWGIVLVAAAVALVLWRYVQERSARALLEGGAVATIAFFVLATRMHERYLFDGLLFTIVCVPFARRYLWGAVALSIVLFANLQYSLQYLYVMDNHVAGVNAQNLWGALTTVLALASVGTFFWLGYQFLGGDAKTAAAPAQRSPAGDSGGVGETVAGVHGWFDPREGLAAMRAPLDYLVMAGFGVLSFVLSFAGYWWPKDKVFDEIYFARAGEEYLQNLRIYENTHPPLTKLLVTLSMMLFGGMPHGHGLGGWTFLNALIGHASNGDNSYGWRFLDVVFGALVVMLLYVFAKRITGSTMFAGITALFLTMDGMHFVQSRIATPEGFVIFFATLAVYAFYRFWISSQVGERPHLDVPEWAFVTGGASALAAGFVLAWVARAIWKFDTASTVLATLYIACGCYLLVRYVVFPRTFGDGRRELTFPEGATALRDAAGATMLAAPDGGTIDDRGKISRGAFSQNRGGTLVYDEDPPRIEYRRDASVIYETPAGSATYAGVEVRAGDAVEKGRSSKLWLVLFTVALGCLVSSKWYGVMGFGVSFLVLIAVFAQRYAFRLRPAQWGNPRGFRLDGALVTIVFVSATVYALVWVPDLLRHSPDPNEIHSVNDVVYRQYSMFEYHDTLKATHPYSSKWWEWPLDLVPVAYFYQDHRLNQNDPNGCCIYEITSMPNPAILWFGLICVPWVAVLAWRERNKGYALIVLTYLLQWLPWMKSPRITFAYHFYVDIPLICLCNAIVLQRIWQWASHQEGSRRLLGRLSVGAYVALAVGTFAYFYPILAAHPITYNAWHQRMWFGYWVIGPG
ncbi:MAG TPA: phospholipid carrier-dependent glycosyltransferase [Candidatus Tumulicola sp.]|nr:phospholipid carrier-dependent glycosyltransferase [Candidatus Tumulicola sp.]